MALKFEKLNESYGSKIEKEFTAKKIEWADTRLFDFLTFNFETRYTNYKKKESQKLSIDINKLIDDYSDSKITYSKFIISLEKLYEQISHIENPDPIYDTYENRLYYFSKYKNIFLSAPGGMGKSRFVYELSKELKFKNIEHLCLYGKLYKSLSEKQINRIINIAESRNFVFIFDAINELNSKKRDEICNLIKCLKKHKNIFIVVTYRDNSLKENPNKKLKLIEIPFAGINYNSVIDMLGPDVGASLLEYGSILSTNNALFIQALLKTVKSGKLKQNGANNINKITYLLEMYTKGTLNLQAWQFYKKFIALLCDHEVKYLEEVYLKTIIKNKSDKDQLQKLIELGYIRIYKDKRVKFYGPGFDTLSDYLIVRSLFKISDTNLLITKIQNLKNKIYSLNDPIVIMLFDKFKNNWTKIKNICSLCKLELNLNALAFIDFNQQEAKDFQKFLVEKNFLLCFVHLGGLNNKLFNCTNYLNKKFLNNSKQITKLLAKQPYLNKTPIEQRIYDILFITTKFNTYNDLYIEYLYFAIWLSAYPHDSLKLLSRKTMVQLFDIDERYEKIAIDVLNSIDNCFICDAIVESLATSRYRKNSSKSFTLKQLLKNRYFLNAYNIAKIERYFNFSPSLFHYVKRNDYLKMKSEWLTDENDRLFGNISLSHKYSLRFDSFGGYTSSINFLKADWHYINRINKKLSKEYLCFKNGKCAGCGDCESSLRKTYKINENNVISARDLATLTSYYFDKLKNEYDLTEKDLHFDYREYSDTMLRSFLEMAQAFMLGTLMGNYYTDDFVTYNGYEGEKIGYLPYKPLEFETDYYSLNSLVPVSSDLVYCLNQKLIKKLGIKNIDKKSSNWATNFADLKLEEVKLHNIKIYHEKFYWIPLVLKVEFHSKNSDGPKQFISYYCAYNTKMNFKDHYKYEFDEYNLKPPDYLKDINDYSFERREDICHMIPAFSRNYHKFEQNSSVMPPSGLIKDLNLSFDVGSSSFKNKSGEQIIIVDCNNSNYYSRDIKDAVYIRADYYEKIKDKIKFFGYGERFHLKTGWSVKSQNDFQFNFNDGGTFFLRKREFEKEFYKKCCGCKKKYRTIRHKVPNITISFENQTIK